MEIVKHKYLKILLKLAIDVVVASVYYHGVSVDCAT